MRIRVGSGVQIDALVAPSQYKHMEKSLNMAFSIKVDLCHGSCLGCAAC